MLQNLERGLIGGILRLKGIHTTAQRLSTLLLVYSGDGAAALELKSRRNSAVRPLVSTE